MSLRELLQRVSEPPYKGVVPSHYELLEALVDAVEALENDDLRKERDGWERGCSEAEQELAEAKAEIERLLQAACETSSRLYAETAIEYHRELQTAQGELAEAKAETEGLRKRNKKWAGKISRLNECICARNVHIDELRKERDEWAKKVVAQANAGTLFVVPNQEFEAAAEIGGLVLGMQAGSTLIRVDTSVFASTSREWLAHSSSGICKRANDPAEALAAIQEVKEHKCE